MQEEKSRDKISVCMATYNGSRYIHEQISSILIQLKSYDELIVTDDLSKDNTVAIVKAFLDSRITLVQNDRHLGVVGTFERAIRAASGDIIFLSDQDDVWYGDKVDNVLGVFKESPNVTLVVSDVEIINDSGDPIDEYRGIRGEFRGGIIDTLIRNRYQGCAMAFRKTLVEIALPFPSGIPMHDSWIGLVNGIAGDVKFLNKSLVRYRRHGENTSGNRRISFYEKIKVALDTWD